MKKVYLLFAIAGLAVAALLTAGLATVFAEEEVSLQQVPEKARATIQEHAGAGKIIKIERETEDSKTIYEAEVDTNGKVVEFQVSEAGEYLGPEAEAEDDEDEEDENGDDADEAAVPLAEVPKPVQDAFNKALAGAQPAKVIRETEDGAVLYEAEYETGGMKRSVKATENGHVVETEQQIAVAELPPAVAEHIKKMAPGAKVKAAQLVTLTLYEIEFEGGKPGEMQMLANGQELEEEDE